MLYRGAKLAPFGAAKRRGESDGLTDARPERVAPRRDAFRLERHVTTRRARRRRITAERAAAIANHPDVVTLVVGTSAHPPPATSTGDGSAHAGVR